MHLTTPSRPLSLLAVAALRTLLYYDVFSYPLKIEEIWKGLGKTSSTDTILALQSELDHLVQQGCLHRFGQYYSMSKEESLVARRERGNERAEKSMKRAYRMGRFIGRFPFVRGVCLSGSISKGYLEADSDLDYFIITKPGRLWVARTFLIAFKKIFLLNSYKYFCVNYFIDTEHLTIEEKNLFTATEVMTLLPVYGEQLFHDFQGRNEWSKTFYPNYPEQSTASTHSGKSGPLKKVNEWLLSGALGTRLDRYFMKLTMKQWVKKFPHFKAEDFELAMRSRTYVSKHHPSNFQRKVLQAHRDKMKAFDEQFGTGNALIENYDPIFS